MKRILILASSLFCFQANAQKYLMDLPDAIIKFSPQHMIRSGLWIGGELFDSRHKMSNQLGLEAVFKKASSFRNNENLGVYETQGFTVEYMFRYFPSKLRIEKRLSSENIGGFYTGLFAQAGNYNDKVGYFTPQVWPASAEYISNTVKTSSFYFGVVLGKEVSISEFMYIDVFLGAGIRTASSTLKTDDEEFPWEYLEDKVYRGFYMNGIIPKAGITLGVGF